MKLIGIKLYECDPFIRKTLKENTWYPFGRYQEPTEGNCWRWWESEEQKNADKVCTKMYQVMAEDKYESLDITVNCIVGKNGSGKSTLLDILYRIINNFSYCLIDKAWRDNTPDKNPQRSHILTFASGVNATLFFESDGVTASVHNCNEDVYYSYYSEKKDARFENIKIDKDFSRTRIDQITRHFFYSICTNYSIHSLNESDYLPPRFGVEDENGNIDGKWIKGLFHKNDGYAVPITMVPYRNENGNIDISNENYLAKQRLATLALLFASQGKYFMGEYELKNICFRLKQNAYSHYESRFVDLCKKKFLNDYFNFVEDLQFSVIECWQTYILKKYKKQFSSLKKNVQDTLLMYFAYKTVKICINYRKYGEVLGLKPFVDNMKRNKRNNSPVFSLKYSHNSIKKVVRLILMDTTIHINQKIHQLLYWLKNTTYDTGNVNDTQGMFNRWNNKPAEMCFLKTEEGRTLPFKTYDQAFLSMPPSIFEWDIRFQKKGSNELESLSQMSSGERQLMHCISYIIYHIKNIESVTEDNYRVRYHNISLIFDEAELYYHPEFQRTFVSNLIKMLSWCHINRNIIRGVNILIVTHSSFVLSDIPLVNTLYLKDGVPDTKQKETFCGNVHELLGGNFFMDYSIGEVAQKNVEEIIYLYNHRYEEVAKTTFLENSDRYRYISSIVADQYLQIKIKDMIKALDELYNSEKYIDEQILAAEKQLQLWKEKKEQLIRK